MNNRALKSELDNVDDELYGSYFDSSFDSYSYSSEESSLRADTPSYIGSYDSSDSSSEVTTPRKGKYFLEFTSAPQYCSWIRLIL